MRVPCIDGTQHQLSVLETGPTWIERNGEASSAILIRNHCTLHGIYNAVRTIEMAADTG
jgi:hypothetical protein